jgi:hypothetical protein
MTEDLLEMSLQRFWELRADKKLFYDETEVETITDAGYIVSLEISPNNND